MPSYDCDPLDYNVCYYSFDLGDRWKGELELECDEDEDDEGDNEWDNEGDNEVEGYEKTDKLLVY